MTPFLQQTAEYYYRKGGLKDRLFILPNRRSAVFFRKYLCGCARSEARTQIAPRLITVNDFFFKVAGKRSADRIRLLIELYGRYKALNPHAESLDDFVYWGDVMLGDFDDIDKYLVDVRGLFANISDLKSIRDDFSYADERQLEAIERLAGHFTRERWSVKDGGRDVKGSFLNIWQLLKPLYNGFRDGLSEAGLAYEGMVYREFAGRLDSESVKDILTQTFPDIGNYVFVGLNALNECEKKVMSKMRDAGLAEFCWDFTGGMLTDPVNVSSFFMKTNVAAFPPAFKPEGGGKPVVNVCGVPSATGQAKMLPDIIASVPEDLRGLDFAVVLPDETMLMPVLNSLPDCPQGINVTMGYPLASSEWAALMKDILLLQVHLREKDGRSYFYHRQVLDVLSSGLLKGLMKPEDEELAGNIIAAAKYYVPQEDFAASELLKTIFRPAGDDIAGYQLELVDTLAPLLADNPLQSEFAQMYYRCVSRLKGFGLQVKKQTWAHLLDQLVAGSSVPFEGEPLGGLQVMGPLETRALDFRNVVILNSNEGVFPRRSVSSSFIPPELRKAFGLPTWEYQDAVWAYYFYRLISRAENVWMIYDSRTEGMQTGEESRYIKQLRHIYPDCCDLRGAVARAEIRNSVDDSVIEKTDEDVEAIRKLTFSASSIQRYISCPASFYYRSLRGLKAEDEVAESLDSGMMGTISHTILERIYSEPEGGVITYGFLHDWSSRPDDIRAMALELTREKIHSIEVGGRDLVTADVITRFVTKVLQTDMSRMHGRESFRIFGHERECWENICGHRFYGVIDRLDDLVDGGGVRIVDYKTGSDRQDSLAETLNVADVFSPEKSHTCKAALQFFIYDRFVSAMPDVGAGRICNSMYSITDLFSGGAETYEVHPSVVAGMEEGLKSLFAEMEDKSVGFRRADRESHACKYCDFAVLCGRTSKG